jgi:Fur family transcriptional regulator, ferric uptake regulator
MVHNEETLRKYSLKVTAPRLAVLSAFEKAKHYTSAQEIHSCLKKIDLVTIYRTLSSFEKAGLIKRVDTRKDSIFYELNEGHHHHVICTNCEKMEEFTEREDEALIKKVLEKVKGFSSISHHSFDLFGLCNSCVKK